MVRKKPLVNLEKNGIHGKIRTVRLLACMYDVVKATVRVRAGCDLWLCHVSAGPEAGRSK